MVWYLEVALLIISAFVLAGGLLLIGRIPEGFSHRVEKNSVFIVGLHISGEPPNTVWHLNGVVLTEEEARAACTKPTHFYAVMEMGKILPDEWVAVPTTFPVKGEAS